MYEKNLILFFAISSCAYGPTKEKKYALNYLNGERYYNSAQVMGVPVVERKIKLTPYKSPESLE